jgi:hypothetical protein
MRAVIICLLIFIVGYTVGKKQIIDTSVENFNDTIIKADSVFKPVSYIETDSIVDFYGTKQ